jgi:molybdopterin-binding protein
LLRVLARLRDVLKIPLVLVSHDVSEVLALATEVVILDGGKVQAHGPTVSLLAELAGAEGVAPNFWEGVVEGAAAPPDEKKAEGQSTAGEPPSPVLQRVRVSATSAVLVPLLDAMQDQRVRLSVEPRHVSLELAGGAGPTASPRNRLRGTVIGLTPSEGLLRVAVDAGVEIAALVTPAAAQELGLVAGVEVVASFKAAAIEVLAVEKHPTISTAPQG